jgi:hypothetical protein
MAHELKFDATTGKILNEYLAQGKIVLIHPAVPCGGCYSRNQHIRIGDYGLAGDGVSRFGNRNTKCEGCGGSGVIPISIKVDKL